MRFKDQVVIVTGGTRGIGASISTSFLKEGAKVIATYSSNDLKANEFKESLKELGHKLELHKFKVQDFKECEDFMKKIEEENEMIHILVNNAGIRRDNILPLMSEEDFDSVIDVNLKGTFNMSKLLTLHFMKNRYGRIINIASIGGVLGLAGQTNYAASKAGQIAMTKVLAKEVGKRNITVNCVLPGFIETELLEGMDPEVLKNYKKDIPLKRFGRASEVSSVVLFLGSEDASYITGSSIEVTGGL